MGPAILITLGVLFLVAEFSNRFSFGDLWPILLIVIGVIKLIEATASTEGHITSESRPQQ
jgi:membrane-bound ClpP family serine protease